MTSSNPAVTSVLSTSLLILLLTTPSVAAADSNNMDTRARYVIYTTVEYYSSPSMTCDHPKLNVSTSADVRSVFWVFPDGTNVHSPADVDPMSYVFSGPSTELVPDIRDPASLALYNLTALQVDDDQFGYYLCVVEYDNGAADNHKPAAVIRWGLNTDGADFSELLETYRQNAIVGGAAAAVLLVVVGGACLFWNVRYGNRNPEDESFSEDGGNETAIKQSRGGDQHQHQPNGEHQEKKFDNAAFDGTEVDASAVVDVHM